MSFYDRYSECCALKGIAPVSQEAADKIGCTKATISAFAKNGTTPKGEFVAGAAQMLDVSADYLLGLINTKRPIHQHGDMTGTEIDVLKMLRSLNEEGVEAAIAMLSGLCSQEIYKKHPSPESLSQKQA